MVTCAGAHCSKNLPLSKFVIIICTKHLTPLVVKIGWKWEMINLVELECPYKVPDKK